MDNWNIPIVATVTSMQPVPTYALYGEIPHQDFHEGLHCESIAQRSRLYDWEIRPHRHELFAQVLIIKAGSGTAKIDDSARRIEAPCALFVPALCVHGFRFSRNVDGVVITVLARWLDRLVAAAPELAAQLASARCISLAGDAEAAGIGRLTQVLLDEWNGAGPWREAAIEAAFTLLMIALGRTDGMAQPGAGAPAPRSVAHMRRFRALVEQSFRKQRSVGHYAARLGLTPTQLNRICRQTLGVSALGALHGRVLVEAKQDLAYSSLSVKAVALTLGFSDAAYFTRFFTRHTGRSPTEFREEARRHLAGGTTAHGPAETGQAPGGVQPA